MYTPGKKPTAFEFDIEKEIKADFKRKKTLLEEIHTHASQVRKALQANASQQEFEELGALLHGYGALEKVINKITR